MPLHSTRRWVVVGPFGPDELAHRLFNFDWCSCNGFEFGGEFVGGTSFYLLNDATGPDGMQEYAVVRKADLQQVDSILPEAYGTVRNLSEWLQALARGEKGCGPLETIRPDLIQTPEEHGRCPLCM